MKISDLGRLEGPIVLFGGPYSNRHALSALLALGQGRSLLCTGDICAYGADARACVDLIRACRMPVVAGNVEHQLATRAQDCGCGFEEGTACDLASRGWFAHADAQMTDDTRAWMDGLPDIAVFTHSGRRYAVIHGGVSANNLFLWATTPEDVLRHELDQLRAHVGPVDGVICGHSGIAFQRRLDGVDWINAGVIGMPPNDGDPRTEYAVLSDGQVSFHRLAYDHHGAARAMQQVGLVQGYEQALLSGHWPSQDILPPQLRRGSFASG